MSVDLMTDYEPSGKSIHAAMLAVGKSRSGRPQGPLAIRWGERIVQTADRFAVAGQGRIRLEFISKRGTAMQGADMKAFGGGFTLADGSVVEVLRTWMDDRYEDVVEYDYTCSDPFISTWNVYENTFASGRVEPAKWGGNAGFWIEHSSPNSRIYHCSAGHCATPDFESLVYRLTVTPRA